MSFNVRWACSAPKLGFSIERLRDSYSCRDVAARAFREPFTNHLNKRTPGCSWAERYYWLMRHADDIQVECWTSITGNQENVTNNLDHVLEEVRQCFPELQVELIGPLSDWATSPDIHLTGSLSVQCGFYWAQLMLRYAQNSEGTTGPDFYKAYSKRYSETNFFEGYRAFMHRKPENNVPRDAVAILQHYGPGNMYSVSQRDGGIAESFPYYLQPEPSHIKTRLDSLELKYK